MNTQYPYVNKQKSIHMCIYIYIQICVYICICTYIYICKYVGVYVYECILYYINTKIHTEEPFTYMCAYIYIYIYISLSVSIHVSIDKYGNLYIYISIRNPQSPQCLGPLDPQKASSLPSSEPWRPWPPSRGSGRRCPGPSTWPWELWPVPPPQKKKICVCGLHAYVYTYK